MSKLDFTKLPRYQERRFVPDDASLIEKDPLVALYQKLLDRQVSSPAELENWLMDISELGAAVDQESSVLYIQMTCQTDDEECSKAYKDFIENVVPAVMPLGDKINRKYLKLRLKFDLDENRYHVHDRNTRADVELFHQENVPLQTKEALLSQEYQTITGAMMVQFEGKERTLPEMAKFLEEPDRDLRERAWRATVDRRLSDKDQLEDIFDKMLALRREIASNAGYENFSGYKFKSYHRFDYTIEDCKEYHDTVERRVVPLWRGVLEERRQKMKLDKLRPWDTAVDPLGRAPLKPFDNPEKLVAGCAEIFEKTDPELGEQFRMMDQTGLLDLSSRKGKAPGGYQSTLNETRKPFIFMNAVGLDRDIWTLLHEGGHAFHALASADEPLVDYRHAPMEFCEVASMGMELLAGDQLAAFYDDRDSKRSRREHLEATIMILPWVATIDAFQHWIYENPGHSRQDRIGAWLAVRNRFGGEIDWSDLEEARKYAWHRQLHIFQVPFYYIEYGIAQLGALQLWVRARQNGSAAIQEYRRALSLGGSKPLPELFSAAGLNFDFSEKTIAPLMEAVAEELASL
jgi:oligoendopeptidase F